MSTVLQEPQTTETVNYLNAEYGWKSWLLTTDHKRIAVLYLQQGDGPLPLAEVDAEFTQRQAYQEGSLTEPPNLSIYQDPP